MKKIVVSTLIFLVGLNITLASEAIKYVTFCYWTVSAITEAKDKEGNIEYSVTYKGATYILTKSQYIDLMDGKDITLKIE